jgi:hypothetical protein
MRRSRDTSSALTVVGDGLRLIEPIQITEWAPMGQRKKFHLPGNKSPNPEFLNQKRPGPPAQSAVGPRCVLTRPRCSFRRCVPGDGGGQPPRGGMGTQFVLWTSRAWVFLADALASLGSEPTRLDALAMPHEPLLSWSVYLANTPAQWLGTVDASTADDAIEVAARKFDTEPERLMAVRRA